ncbi:uncharacterized protein DS421_17g588450 [Arachis hypogaea]|nr:uncharacterized protein DS421_17g588450 [Arachis hypogaea]
MCLNVTRAAPDSELQIVEFRQQTPSQPLEVHPLALPLPSSVQEELIRDDFIYVPPQNETQQTSNNDPAKEQQQQSKEPLVAEQSEQEAHVNVRPLEQQQQSCEEPTAQQSEQAPVDVCPPEPKKQDVMVSLTSSVIEEFFKDDDVYDVSDEEQKQQSQEPPVARQSEQETLILSSFDSAAQPREREYKRPSFSLGISPPASQPSQPSQPTVSQLEILEEAVVDAGVTIALKFVEATSSEPTLPASKVYKTLEKKTKITNELIEKCYHWMTHVKQTKDSTNEYERVFVLKHEPLYEGLRKYFMSLMPEQQVHATVNPLPIALTARITIQGFAPVRSRDLKGCERDTLATDLTSQRKRDEPPPLHRCRYLDRRVPTAVPA